MLRARTTCWQPEALANQAVCKQLPAARASRLAVWSFAWGVRYAVDSDVLQMSWRLTRCFEIVAYCDNHVVGLYDAYTHVVNPRYGSDTTSNNTMTDYEQTHLLAALTGELSLRQVQFGQGDRALKGEICACEQSRFDVQSKARSGRKMAVELGKMPAAKERVIDASGKHLKQGLNAIVGLVRHLGTSTMAPGWTLPNVGILAL